MKLFNITKESNKYISNTLWNPLPTFPVFGGQIVAQALCAAYETVDPTSEIHSLHCYFLSPAKVSDNIEYKVDTNKNGNLLENRNVIAMQHNTIFTMTASFTKPYRKGHNYQQKKLMDDKYVPFNDVIKAIEPKLLDHLSFLDEYMSIYKGEKSYKYELKQKLNEKDMSCFIAFISDMFLLESALHVMDENFFSKNVRKIASIDHTLYFHASCSDTVLYFVPECVSIREGKAYCIGYIFDSKGMHIATACQEGLIRLNNE